MSLRSLSTRLGQRRFGETNQSMTRFRPLLETLEDRQLLASSLYQTVNLVSDLPKLATIQDSNLVDPWGVALGGSTFWVANNGTGSTSSYTGDVNGNPLVRNDLLINMPGGFPTAVVVNSTNDFVINGGPDHAVPATILFASEAGVIAGWNPNLASVATTQASAAVKLPGAMFTGLTLGNMGGSNFLYAADFSAGTIHMFDGSFNEVSSMGPVRQFFDPNLPKGYSPFNIQNVSGTLYVTYALQNANGQAVVPGPGNGFVDAFDLKGNFLRRVVSAGNFNSPWGLALAPSNFGSFSNTLLIGNYGDGTINAFDPQSGVYLGTLAAGSGKAITIPGLHSLMFSERTVSNVRSTSSLYFTAGPDDGAHGLFGRIDLLSGWNAKAQAGLALVGSSLVSGNRLVSSVVPVSAKVSGVTSLDGQSSLASVQNHQTSTDVIFSQPRKETSANLAGVRSELLTSFTLN